MSRNAEAARTRRTRPPAIAELHDEPGHDPVDGDTVVEAGARERREARRGNRRERGVQPQRQGAPGLEGRRVGFEHHAHRAGELVADFRGLRRLRVGVGARDVLLAGRGERLGRACTHGRVRVAAGAVCVVPPLLQPERDRSVDERDACFDEVLRPRVGRAPTAARRRCARRAREQPSRSAAASAGRAPRAFRAGRAPGGDRGALAPGRPRSPRRPARETRAHPRASRWLHRRAPDAARCPGARLRAPGCASTGRARATRPVVSSSAAPDRARRASRSRRPRRRRGRNASALRRPTRRAPVAPRRRTATPRGAGAQAVGRRPRARVEPAARGRPRRSGASRRRTLAAWRA